MNLGASGHSKTPPVLEPAARSTEWHRAAAPCATLRVSTSTAPAAGQRSRRDPPTTNDERAPDLLWSPSTARLRARRPPSGGPDRRGPSGPQTTKGPQRFSGALSSGASRAFSNDASGPGSHAARRRRTAHCGPQNDERAPVCPWSPSLGAHSALLSFERSSAAAHFANHIGWPSFGKIAWRRPTLPHSRPCSTIGSEELDFRVRDGIGYGLFDKVARSLGVYFALRIAVVFRLRRWIAPAHAASRSITRTRYRRPTPGVTLNVCLSGYGQAARPISTG